MRAIVEGTLRSVQKKVPRSTNTDGSAKKPYAMMRVEQMSDDGVPFFVDVCTYDADGKEIGKKVSVPVNISASGRGGQSAFLNVWEVSRRR